MNYFISDLHLFHQNCISFDNRPFETIFDMHNAIINNWNSVVCPDDDVYFLGDLSFGNLKETYEVLKQLNGKLHWIMGNHDRKYYKAQSIRYMFVEICEYKQLNIDSNTSIILSHYPIPMFKNMYKGWYHLYGHVHTSFEWNMVENMKSQLKALYSKKDGKPKEKVCNMYNVGCMLPYMNYTPRTIEEIIDSNKS